MALAAVASVGLHARLTSGWNDWDDPSAGNVQARSVIEQATGIDSLQGYALLVRTDQHIDASLPPPPRVQAAIDILRHRREVRQVLDYHSAANPALISRDGHQTVLLAKVGRVVEKEVVSELQKQLADNPDLAGHVRLGGPTVADVQGAEVVIHDLTFAEMIVFPLLFGLLIIIFRGVVAALVALVGGATCVLLALLGMRIVLQFTAMSVYGLNLTFALGLGLSIDFSLLIVSRFRQQLVGASDATAALRATMVTAGRTVLFSGLTIASALLGLLIFPQEVLHSMGIAGILVTASALCYALLILPAILSALGGRIELFAPLRWQRRDQDPTAARWRRIADRVMRRPALSAMLAAAALMLLASPLLDVRFTSILTPDSLPAAVSSGQVAQAMNRDFSAPISDEEQIIVDAPADAGADVGTLANKVRAVAGVASVAPPRLLDDRHWLIAMTPGGAPISAASRATIDRVERLASPYGFRLTGPTADALALNRSLGKHLLPAAAVLMAATILVLFMMTRSVVLPAKAVVMNALSLGAALGSVAFVFQEGHLAGLLGAAKQDALDSTSPIVLAAVAFGLSTDYGVFLLGRIKESHDDGEDNREAVATGYKHTGRIVTSAAGLLCLSMSALLFSRVVFVKELGLGATLAVILDATIVRAVLVPSLMTLLGHRNWWAPSLLRTLHARLSPRRSDSAPGANAGPGEKQVTPANEKAFGESPYA
ncbi:MULTISPECIES: MMPL family transporter [unclassified Mycobacterium]|uniref:MMPL family transporter n=1 Tax=unclassified Mycobacterium TaxID=2642494 RepID=UPI0018D44C23|nr:MULTISPECIES: MMPL family transporter [unclassified Mycobacterium]